MRNKIKIGTRKSLLALAQTELVAKRLKDMYPSLEIEIIKISTVGDERLNKALSSFGGKGVFTKELEEALLRGDIDFAVHSAKDMPMVLPDGLCIGGVLEREDVSDVLVTMKGHSLEQLTEGAVIGTGSLRRKLQIEAILPGICVKEIRGNVQTRLEKLASGDYDGIILAQAGLKRLNYQEVQDFDYQRFEYHVLSQEQMLPAACQGILGVEARVDDEEILDMLSSISHKETWEILQAERSFLTCIDGGCNAPAAARAWIEADLIKMEAMYAPEDTNKVWKIKKEASVLNGVKLGEMIANELKQMALK